MDAPEKEETTTTHYAAQIEGLLAVERVGRDTVSLRSITGKKSRRMYLPSHDAVIQFMRSGAADQLGDDASGLPRHVILCIAMTHPAVFSRMAQAFRWLGLWTRRPGVGFAVAQYFALRQGVVVHHHEDTLSFGFGVAGRRHGLSIVIHMSPATALQTPRDAIADDGRSTINYTHISFQDRGRDVPGTIHGMRFGANLAFRPGVGRASTWQAWTDNLSIEGTRDGVHTWQCLKCRHTRLDITTPWRRSCATCRDFGEMPGVPTSLQEAIYIYYNNLIDAMTRGVITMPPPMTMLRRRKMAREAANARDMEVMRNLLLKYDHVKERVDKRKMEDQHDEEARLKRIRNQ
jgi:hypothetical protein